MKAKLLQEKAIRQKQAKLTSSTTSSAKAISDKTKKSKSLNVASTVNLKKAKKEESNVVYLGHVPNGFFEPQMYSFFNQFGKVEKLKHFRNPKTNRSRGYAFIKFESPEVAVEVASTMNGYFLNDRQLKCEIVPMDRQHEGMFLPPKKKSDTDTTKTESTDEQEDKIENDETEEVTDDVKAERRLRSFNQRQKKIQDKLNALGINFDLSQVSNK